MTAMTRTTLQLAAVAALVFSVACEADRRAPSRRSSDDDDSGEAVDDDDAIDDDDAGPPDPGDLDVATTVTGNFECVGERPAPPPGVTGELILSVEDFHDAVAVAQAHVEVWPGNNPADTAFSFEGVTDLAGEVEVPAGQVRACTLFALRTFTLFDPPESYQAFQTNLVVSGEPPWRATVTSISFATYQLTALSLGVEVERGMGIAAGHFRDCDGEPIGNAEVEIGRLNTTTGEFTPAPDYAMRYYNGNDDPDLDQTHLAVGGGFFAGLNVPPDSAPWDILAWGIPQNNGHCLTTDGGSTIRPLGYERYCLLGRNTVAVLPDSVNLSNIELKPFPDACYEER
jgi:hypothetical protein